MIVFRRISVAIFSDPIKTCTHPKLLMHLCSTIFWLTAKVSINKISFSFVYLIFTHSLSPDWINWNELNLCPASSLFVCMRDRLMCLGLPGSKPRVDGVQYIKHLTYWCIRPSLCQNMVVRLATSADVLTSIFVRRWRWHTWSPPSALKVSSHDRHELSSSLSLDWT